MSHVLATHRNWQNTKGLRCRWSSHACWKLETLEVAPRVSPVRMLGVCLWKRLLLPKIWGPFKPAQHLRDFNNWRPLSWKQQGAGTWNCLLGLLGSRKSSTSHPNLGVQPFVFNLWMVYLLWPQDFHSFSQAFADSGTLCRTMLCWMVSPWDSFCPQRCTKTSNKNAWQTTSS